MRCLVTGATGFVGKYLLTELEDNGHEYLAVGSEDFDILDEHQVVQTFSEFLPDAVYHLAAMSHVPTCQQHLAKTLDVNVGGTANVVKAALSLEKKPKLIFISSANLYGYVKPEDNPILESQKVAPANNYALSKYMAEGLISLYEKESGVDCVIFRPFNHIGPDQTDSFVVASFAKQIIEIKQGKQKKSLKWGIYLQRETSQMFEMS